MGASAPAEVGTKGTIGSLVKKEIEYFRRIKVDHNVRNSDKSYKNFADAAFTESNSCLNIEFLIKRRNKKNSSFRLPGNCSVIEVADSYGDSWCKYKNLKAQDL